MNSLLKAFMGISIGYAAIMLLFWDQFGVVPFLLFLASYIPMAGVVIYDEFISIGNWPVKAFLFELREGTERLITTRAKRIAGKFGKYFYVIKGKKGKTKAIDFRHISTFKSGFRAEDTIMLYSPAPGQYHPITMEKAEEISKKLKVVPQELLNVSIETHRDQWQAHPDKKKGWALLFENPVLLCSVAFVILLIGIGIFLMQFLIPAIQEGQVLGMTMQKQAEASNELLMRWNGLLNRIEATPMGNQTLLPKPG